MFCKLHLQTHTITNHQTTKILKIVKNIHCLDHVNNTGITRFIYNEHEFDYTSNWIIDYLKRYYCQMVFYRISNTNLKEKSISKILMHINEIQGSMLLFCSLIIITATNIVWKKTNVFAEGMAHNNMPYYI